VSFRRRRAAGSQTTWVSASAGRSLAIRQLPNAPASRAPATARTTASTITPAVIDGCSGMATTCDAVAGSAVGGTALLGLAAWAVACESAAEEPGTVAEILGATVVMIAAPAKPRPAPAAR